MCAGLEEKELESSKKGMRKYMKFGPGAFNRRDVFLLSSRHLSSGLRSQVGVWNVSRACWYRGALMETRLQEGNVPSKSVMGYEV